MSNSNPLISALNGIVGEPNVIQDPIAPRPMPSTAWRPRLSSSPEKWKRYRGCWPMPIWKSWPLSPRQRHQLAAGGIPGKIDLVLSMLRINRITEHDIPNLSLSVEAGITLAEVQKKLAGRRQGFVPASGSALFRNRPPSAASLPPTAADRGGISTAPPVICFGPQSRLPNGDAWLPSAGRP